jgi:adenylylsulfate kinase-like enzyme
LAKVVKKVAKKLLQILSKSCQIVVTNFVSPGKNEKKVNRPANKNKNGNKKKKKKKIIGVP